MYTLMLCSQMLLLVYHQVTTLFDFYPFNNIRNYSWQLRLTEVPVNGLIMAVPPVGYLFGIPWMQEAAVWVYVGVSVGAWLSWYQMHFFAPTSAQQARYGHIFRPTIQVLPGIQNRPRPNLEHVILHGILLITLVLTVLNR